MLAGSYADPSQSGRYLLRIGGARWARVVVFGPDVHAEGVAAVSAGEAWVWAARAAVTTGRATARSSLMFLAAR